MDKARNRAIATAIALLLAINVPLFALSLSYAEAHEGVGGGQNSNASTQFLLGNLRNTDDIKGEVLSELSEDESMEYVEGEVIVVFNGEHNSQEAKEILEDVNAVDESLLSDGSMISGDVAVVSLSEESGVTDAILELNENPDVAFAQPNYVYRTFDEVPSEEAIGAAAVRTNDPSRSSQWGLDTARVYDAWQLTQAIRANPRVGIAVLDSGIVSSHDDLAANVCPGSYYDFTREHLTDGDQLGHGTHVAGIASAVADNGVGVAGVSYNAGLVPLKVFYRDETGKYVSNTSFVISAFKHLFTAGSNGQTPAQRYNVKVVNMSLGGYGSDPALASWVTYAEGRGVLTVAAAGNDSTDKPTYPAAYANALSVSALRQGSGVLNDEFDSSYSNYGSTIDISAPGTNIYSTLNTSTTAYGYMQGTSMAAPFVSGCAALVFAANPAATPAQVRTALQSTAKDLGLPGWDQYYGHGEVDPCAAAWQIAVTGITYTASLGVAIPVTCSIKTTLPCPLQWIWSVDGTNGTIDSSGVFTPSRSGSLVVKAIYTNDPTCVVSVVVVVPYTHPGITVATSAHVQYRGWMAPVPNGSVAGTVGSELRVEALRIDLVNTTKIPGGISYSTQVQYVGWQAPRMVTSTGYSSTMNHGEEAGTSGQSLRIETIRMNLTGKLAESYNIYYRAHVQNYGWLNWAKNGEYAAGSVGLSLRMEAVQIYLAPKTESAPGSSFNGATSSASSPCVIDVSAAGRTGALSYDAMAHIQYEGDTYYKNVNGATTLGTTGSSLRLEGLELALKNTSVVGSISYSVHVQYIGWQAPRTNGALAGTEGQSLRLEALRINLTGKLAEQCDVYYRTHIQYIGWTGWAKNGQSCGSAGYSYRMEAMQIVIMPKNTIAPGFNASYFYQT